MLRALGFLSFWVTVWGASYEFEYSDLMRIRLKLGTPEQGSIEFGFSPSFSNHSSYDSISVCGKSGGGPYNPLASTTFKSNGGDPKNHLLFGTESIRLIGGPKIANIPLRVIRDSAPVGYLSLHYGAGGQKSPIDRILETLGGHRTLVLAIRRSDILHHEGKLILGEPNPKDCAKDWTVLQSHEEGGYQMVVDVDDIRFGKYRRSERVGLKTGIGLPALDPQTHQAVAKQLNANPKTQQIDCDEKREIVISAGGLRWSIGPKDYMSKGADGKCRFEIFVSRNRLIELPVQFHNRKCIRFDYEKKTVSFSRLLK